MGGEITWTCEGSGNYVFTLKIHRDCSGPTVNLTGQSLQVWNHPSVNSINLTHLQTNEVSPNCTEVAGGPLQISCGSNQVPGAAEEYIFTSSPINLSGIPPAGGWVFTWGNVTRNASVSNLASPNSKGITLRAIMYSNGTNASPCFDSSPQFIESPSTIICAGNSFTYSPNAYDPDLDSLVFSFGQPLDIIQTAYTPPTDPVPLNYVAGYSVTSPLPSTSQNASNVPASINPKTGEITFQSFTLGSFALVVKVEAYRCNVLLSEVYREMQIIIVSCGNNSPPVITPPFNGNTSFHDTVTAGSLVNFNLSATDSDLLQNNTNQSIEISATGSQFGTGYTNATTGCDSLPCATLGTPSVTGVGTATINFQWQTDCRHLKKGGINACANTNNSSTYNFVFKVTDDFCPAPAVTYQQVSITVTPPTNLPAPNIACASVLPNGDITLTWEGILDPLSIFQSYEVFASNGGAFTPIGSVNNINTTTFTHTGANGQNTNWEYRIGTQSSCNIINLSDTIKTIQLTVNNPNNGEAVLQWNSIMPLGSNPTGIYHIYKEYPKGTWSLIDSVPFGRENYRDTITVCDDSVFYRIEIPRENCTSTSNVAGDRFENQLAPKIPEIQYVSVDTATGNARICWYPSKSTDTEGYIILRKIGNSWQPIDTVYARDSLCYTDQNYGTPNFNSEYYGVAAFDSCWRGTPASPNTSAMGSFHCSMFTQTTYDVCSSSATLSWNSYINWGSGVGIYQIISEQNGITTVEGQTTNDTSFTVANLIKNRPYCFVVRAISGNLKDTAISNKVCLFTSYPLITDTNYMQVVTVENNQSIKVEVFSETTKNIRGYQIERAENNGAFSTIGVAPFTPPVSVFTDNNVFVNSNNYTYRASIIDSCGFDTAITTNIGESILLRTTSNSGTFTNQLNWNAYTNWDGGVVGYDILRKTGTTPFTSIASVGPTDYSYTDDVSAFFDQNTLGQFCYKIRAIENTNQYGFSLASESNESCTSIDYLLYVPNAFTPGGFNPIFKPVIGFANFETYSLTIFNRLAKEIFSTNDVNEGWDGTYKGQNAPLGVYIYFIQFRDAKGKAFERTGHVVLIK